MKDCQHKVAPSSLKAQHLIQGYLLKHTITAQPIHFLCSFKCSCSTWTIPKDNGQDLDNGNSTNTSASTDQHVNKWILFSSHVEDSIHLHKAQKKQWHCVVVTEIQFGLVTFKVHRFQGCSFHLTGVSLVQSDWFNTVYLFEQAHEPDCAISICKPQCLHQVTFISRR